MSSKNLLSIKSKLKRYLKDKNILDILVFGSAIKGKAMPADIDIAIIQREAKQISIPGFHVSLLTVEDFFVNPPSLIHTLLREGYSLKNNKFLSEMYKFSNKVLFKYELSSLNASTKVKIVNLLRGRKNEEGIVKENKGEWLANQVFIIPIEKEDIFNKFFINFKVKFNKFYILIH